MTRANKGLIVVACGMVLFVGAVFGWIGESILFLGVSLVLLIFGLGLLISTQSWGQLIAPHPSVYGVLLVAVALHLYENVAKASGFSYGWFLWALSPYVLVLALSCVPDIKIAALAGGVLALLVDGWTHYEVFVEPKGSTAALALIWMPIWNTLLFVPIATWVTRLVLRHRRSPNAP